MKKKNLSDSELIELLHQLPSVDDKRSMSEVYSSVIQKVNQENQKNTKKFKRYVLPAFATAACLVLGIIGLNYFNSTFNGFESADDNKNVDRSQDQINAIEPAADKPILGLVESPDNVQGNNGEKTGDPINDTLSLKINEEEWKTPVFEDSLNEGEYAVTLGLPDEQAQVFVPVSVIVKEVEGKNWLEQYNEIQNLINEEELGFSENYPLQANLFLDNQGNVNIDLYKNHSYSYGLTTETFLLKSIEVLRYINVKEIFLLENSVPGAYLSHIGDVNHFYTLNPEPKNAYFIFETNEKKYLCPSNISVNTINEALMKMKKEVPVDNLLPSIPNNISFTINSSDPSKLIISFDKGTILKETIENRIMIDAILLTAKDFGYQYVLFENINLDSIGPYDFSEAIKVPISPNLIGSYE